MCVCVCVCPVLCLCIAKQFLIKFCIEFQFSLAHIQKKICFSRQAFVFASIENYNDAWCVSVCVFVAGQRNDKLNWTSCCMQAIRRSCMQWKCLLAISRQTYVSASASCLHFPAAKSQLRLIKHSFKCASCAHCSLIIEC